MERRYQRAYEVFSTKWKIPEKKPLDVISDYLSRHDELLCLIGKILIDIDQKLDNIGNINVNIDTSSISSVIASSMARLINELENITKEQISEMAKSVTRPQPVEMINSNKISVTTSKDERWNIDDGTDVIVLQNIGDNKIRYMFNSQTNDSSPQILSGGAIMLTIPKKYKILYLRGVDGSSEVIVSEWRYV